MKYIFFLLILATVFISPKASAQTPPEAFNYQAVVRKDDTSLVRNSVVSFRISILDSFNNIVYRETRSITTDAFGLVNFEIGNGTPDTTLQFSDIAWGAQPHQAQVEIDINAGTDYKFLSKRKLLSVPYALYAKSSGNFFATSDGLDTNTVGNTVFTSVKAGNGIIVDTSGVRVRADVGIIVGPNGVGIATGGVTNAMLQNSTITINPGTGLSGGGTVQLGGTISLSNSGVTSVSAGTGLSGGTITATGTIELANSGVSAGTYGSATQVPSFTVNAQGQITSASNITISGVAPGGSATGDLSGNYPNPLVDGLQGFPVSNSTPTNGQVLQWNGSSWVPTSLPAATSDVPVGAIFPFAGPATAIPTGWLLCDGSPKPTSGTFNPLFTVIGYAWGGSGSTFYIPDLRGMFLRGVDDIAGNDPDATGRLPSTINNGGNDGNKVGSRQPDEFESHIHTVTVEGSTNNSNNGYNITNLGSSPPGGLKNTSPTGGSETRPINKYVNYIIKH